MDTPGAFQILVFTARRLADEQGLEATLADAIEHYQGSWIARWPGTGAGATVVNTKKATLQFVVHVISHSGLDATIGKRDKGQGYGKLYLDSEVGNLHKRYGITARGGIVVVRPDTHISYRVVSIGKGAWTDVDEYFGSILCRS
jgi:hypothetical protein